MGRSAGRIVKEQPETGRGRPSLRSAARATLYASARRQRLQDQDLDTSRKTANSQSARNAPPDQPARVPAESWCVPRTLRKCPVLPSLSILVLCPRNCGRRKLRSRGPPGEVSAHSAWPAPHADKTIALESGVLTALANPAGSANITPRSGGATCGQEAERCQYRFVSPDCRDSHLFFNCRWTRNR